MVLASGCFDGIHSGHVEYLHAVASLAQPHESVAVAVAPDAYIDAHKHRRPHWLAQERARAVQGVKGVEWVRVADAVEVIRQERPRIFAKGIDWAGKLPEDVATACREVGCLVVFVDCPGTHTSEAIG